MNNTLLILAAGVGSRFGGLKQLEPIGPCGETLLEYSVFDALQAGFDRLVLVIRRETESEFRRVLDARLAERIALSYVYQELEDIPDGSALPEGRRKPWGTAHAVLASEHKIHGPFSVINADDFYGAHAFIRVGNFLNSLHEQNSPIFALAGYSVASTLSHMGPVSRGLIRVDKNGWLKKIVEILELSKHGTGGRFIDPAGTEQFVPGDELVSMNMWGFTPAVFDELRFRFRGFLGRLGESNESSPEFLLPDVCHAMIVDGRARIRVLRHDGQWCGMTFAEDRNHVRDFIASMVVRGEYPETLWN